MCLEAVWRTFTEYLEYVGYRIKEKFEQPTLVPNRVGVKGDLIEAKDPTWYLQGGCRYDISSCERIQK